MPFSSCSLNCSFWSNVYCVLRETNTCIHVRNSLLHIIPVYIFNPSKIGRNSEKVFPLLAVLCKIQMVTVNEMFVFN